MTTVSLTPAQRAILGQAVGRREGRIDWFPPAINAGAQRKVHACLAKRGLAWQVRKPWQTTSRKWSCRCVTSRRCGRRCVRQNSGNLRGASTGFSCSTTAWSLAAATSHGARDCIGPLSTSRRPTSTGHRRRPAAAMHELAVVSAQRAAGGLGGAARDRRALRCPSGRHSSNNSE